MGEYFTESLSDTLPLSLPLPLSPSLSLPPSPPATAVVEKMVMFGCTHLIQLTLILNLKLEFFFISIYLSLFSLLILPIHCLSECTSQATDLNILVVTSLLGGDRVSCVSGRVIVSLGGG